MKSAPTFIENLRNHTSFINRLTWAVHKIQYTGEGVKIKSYFTLIDVGAHNSQLVYSISSYGNLRTSNLVRGLKPVLDKWLKTNKSLEKPLPLFRGVRVIRNDPTFETPNLTDLLTGYGKKVV